MKPATTTVRSVDGVDLVAHDLGGTGPAVVFIHATGLHGLVWLAVADQLVDRYRCVSYDARGHGDSGGRPGGDYAWPGQADDVLAVVDGLGLERPSGVGHSAGATVLLLAEQARQGTFRKLYCYEPVIVPVDPPLGPDPGNWLAAAARRRRDTFASRDQAYDHYRAKPPLSSLSAVVLRAYVDHGFEDLPDGGVRLKCRRETEAAVHEMATAHDAFARLADVACPVLVAGGSSSDAFAPALVAAQVAPLPDARVEVLPGLGHLGPLEDPGAAAASIHRFLAEDTTGQIGRASSQIPHPAR